MSRIRVRATHTLAALILLGNALPRTAPGANRLDPAPEGTFTIAVIPDTHAGAPELNRLFDNHTRWIAANIVTQRIVFVSHVGDIVNRRPGYGSNDNLEPWRLAQACMDRLHGLVPYALAVGNHDMSGGDSSRFQEFFPASRFAGFEWYGGCYPGRSERPAHESGNIRRLALLERDDLVGPGKPPRRRVKLHLDRHPVGLGKAPSRPQAFFCGHPFYLPPATPILQPQPASAPALPHGHSLVAMRGYLPS